MQARRFGLLMLMGAALAGCEALAAPTGTPLPTLSGPSIAPSAVPARPNPGELLPEDFIGISDPTAAALAPDAALPPLPNPNATAEGLRQPIEITALDGSLLTGDLFMVALERQPGVLLLAEDRLFWGDFPARLAEAGFTALAMDLRAESQDPLADFEVMVLSLTSGLIQPDRLAVVGANAGADLALLGCGAEPLCDAAALLSPASGQDPAIAMGNYGPRPIFITASQEDEAAFARATALQAAAQGQAFFQPLQGAGTGTDILFNREDVADLLTQWLQRTLSG